MRATTSLLFLAILPSVHAQSFNVDVGTNFACCYPVPATTYGAAAAQTGTWNASIHPYSTALVKLDGSPSAVTTSSTLAGWYNYFPSTLGGDDYNFMVDIQNQPSAGLGPWFWTISGLQDGGYAVYTYAWAPENTGAITRVTVAGAVEGPQNVGGAWGGSPHVLGVTYALHHVTVSGGMLSIEAQGIASSGAVNGFQLVYAGNGTTTYCFGDGTGTACPCANAGAAGNGCANSIVAAGAHLGTMGTPSIGADTLALQGSGMPDSSALYFQGTSQSGAGGGVVFGDGLRCVAGTVVRLGTKTNSSGASTYPSGPDLSVSVRGGCTAGDVRNYQVWYRNAAAFCTASTFNLSNGVQVTWQP